MQQYWCHNCQKISNLPTLTQCPLCFSEALQLMDMNESNNPSQHVPFEINPNSNQNHEHVHDPFAEFLGRSFFGNSGGSFFDRMILNPPTIHSLPRITTFRVLIMPQEEQIDNSVPQQKISQLPKIHNLESECAICQQKEGSGLKLHCKHEFHEQCIKPWFDKNNTCPCCRVSV